MLLVNSVIHSQKAFLIFLQILSGRLVVHPLLLYLFGSVGSGVPCTDSHVSRHQEQW